MKSSSKYQESLVQEASGDYLLPKRYVDNDPFKPTRVVFSDFVPTEEHEVFMREYDARILRRRTENFSEGVNVLENIQKIDTDLMEEAASNWSYMPLPSKEQLIALMTSIETIGLINPIILLKHPNYPKYTILSGKLRVLALKNLYARDPQEKYKCPVCFILDAEKVDQYYLRTLMLDLNFNYRDIPQEVFIQMVLERYELLTRSKQYRSESNVAEKLAEEFFMSKSSIYNYVVLRKLTEEVKTLLFEKRITLQIARLFTKVSHEVQIMILENIDFKDVNCFHRMKFIISKGEAKNDLENIKNRIEISKNLVPEEISFRVTINKRLLEKTSDCFIDLKKYASINLSGNFGDNSDRFCKISFDEEQMNYYIEQSLIDEKVVTKLRAKTIREIMLK